MDGKRVLVTGASSGIGAAVARRFAARGAHVLVHFNANRDGAEAVVAAISADGGHAAAVQADLLDPAQADALVRAAHTQLGGLDILVNNAGAMFGRRPLAEAADEHYDKVLSLNVESLFRASREAARYFMAQRSGCIINTSSIAARTGGGDGVGLYGAAKAFVATLTKVQAKELAPFNVRVNAVAPGVITTRFHEISSTPEQLEMTRRTIPMGRLGTAEDCVGAFEFLADDRMSGYITGQTIEVNGGQLMP